MGINGRSHIFDTTRSSYTFSFAEERRKRSRCLHVHAPFIDSGIYPPLMKESGGNEIDRKSSSALKTLVDGFCVEGEQLGFQAGRRLNDARNRCCFQVSINYLLPLIISLLIWTNVVHHGCCF
jgi:hypothetical protein